MVVPLEAQTSQMCAAPAKIVVDPEYAQLTEIVPHLFICGVSALTPEIIDQYDISYIVNATSEVPNLRILGPVPRCKLWLDDTDDADILQHFDLIPDQIHAVIGGGGNVLVHCVAGVSRSAAICLAYLTKFRCKTLRRAYNLMAEKRPLVRPNIGFWRQLIAFEEIIKNCKPSVKIVVQPLASSILIPDIYIDTFEERQRLPRADKKRKHRCYSDKLKFKPVLESVPE